ncbi:MAG: class I SAM-dependent methyltransferase [Candidatus Sulfopaludibacter sp.]|nr:class I SAM-dependent methyltransferase [Candidatus Sulfopaludibacter sp.]
MRITRTLFLLALAGGAFSVAADGPKMHLFERQDFVVADFQAVGYILDIGGGGEGIIGQMKPTQTIAVDLSKRELEEAPAGPLKIVMDATDLKFLDGSFDTATAFFSLMYMRPEVQRRVFAEVFRVLRREGRWIIWDAEIPLAPEEDTRGPVFRFRFQLPGRVVQTGYGTFWPEKPMDLDYYKRLARETGFEIARAEQQAGAFHTVTLELRKPK